MSYRLVEPKPNFPEIEIEVKKYWEDSNIFEKSLQSRKGNDPFIFYEGPPTANAAPGLHHVLARAFKDAICRFQTMRGKYVLRKAGWDTHGLPVELQIEKKLGISGKKQIENIVPGDPKASIAEFNKLCRESVWQYKEEWEKMTERMGFWIDMSDPYITYDPKYIESVWWLLSELHKRDLVYEGHKVVPYCPRCGTALSSHEVAQGYEEVTEPSVYIKFQIKDQPNTFILSWTTTPWTLPGNLALAVGEKIDYVKVLVGQEYWFLAKNRLSILDAGYKQVEDLKGADMVGLKYEPLFDVPELKSEKSYKVYAADFVTTEEGTGVVHTAVMYGEDDYQMGEKVGLPKFHTVDETGKFIDSVPDVGGMEVKDSVTEDKILSYLKSKNLLFKAENYTHTYPHCWRCGTALLYYARNSWYIKMSQLREQLIQNNNKIHWEPGHLKDGRFGEWLREVKDWAISRERYWGTPLPFWRCQECKELTVLASFSDLGTEVDVDKVHRPYVDDLKIKCKKCGGETLRTPEVLDVWFDSGAMPYAQWHYPFESKEMIERKKMFPADYISEAVDQTRGWFYTLHAISTAMGLGPAYKQAISVGHILDDKGQKMSKSKGNIVDPWEVFNNWGADCVRWYFFSVNQPGESKLFKKDDLSVVQRKVFTILSNVYNYFATYANARGWQYDDNKSPEQSKKSGNILDQWLNARLQEVVNISSHNTEELNIFRAVREIERYIDDLSTWYLRRSRNRTDEAFFATLHHSLIYLTKVMAPFSPFFAEYIYRSLHNPAHDYSESVHLSDWPEVKSLSDENQKLIGDMIELRKAAELGNGIRKQKGVKSRQPLPSVWVEKDNRPVEWSNELKQLLLEELNVKELKKADNAEVNEGSSLRVSLDLTVTDELRFEGDVRELERAVQALRRQAGLKVGEGAVLYYEVPAVLDNLIDSINKDRLSLVKMLSQKKIEVRSQNEIELTGGKVWLGVEKK